MRELEEETGVCSVEVSVLGPYIPLISARFDRSGVPFTKLTLLYTSVLKSECLLQKEVSDFSGL